MILLKFDWHLVVYFVLSLYYCYFLGVIRSLVSFSCTAWLVEQDQVGLTRSVQGKSCKN
jgi:hypothetical protein